MILRKPYAFLIKYFRIIHIILFAIFVYLVFALREMHLFFLDYLNNSYMYFENMADKYISIVLFIAVFIMVALSVGIYFLMRKKDKPVLFYRIVIIYGIVLFIALIYFYYFFKSLSTTNYSPLQIVINRDIITAIYYINYLFVGFSFARGFGFDIKKFSFDQDRKELNLEENDREEYEVNISIEKDDVKKYVNTQKREFKYYFKENATFFIIASIILVISLSLYFAYNHFVVNKVYHENQDIVMGNITYRVNKSIITKTDKYGKVINDDNDFLVVYLTIKNKGNKLTLNDQQFRVNVLDEYYYPVISYCNSFSDLGECYHDPEISKNSEKEYIVIYKIGKKHQNISFEILKNKNGYQYNNIKLASKNLNKEIKNYNIGDELNINNNNYQVNSYELLTKTSYNYEECNNNVCNKYTKLITPKLGNHVLAIEINNLNTLADDVISNYFGLRYRNKVLYGSDIEVIARNNNMIYFGIPNLVHKEDRLILTINTRNTEYDILLKEGVNE